MHYGLDLDECFDELWHYMERVQDGISGHTISIKADSKQAAALRLSNKLMTFFEDHMYESNEYGQRKDSK